MTWVWARRIGDGRVSAASWGQDTRRSTRVPEEKSQAALLGKGYMLSGGFGIVPVLGIFLGATGR